MAGIITTDLLLINRGGADYQATVGDLPPNASANPGVDPPDNPKEGDIWFNPENGQLYVWYVDPNSEQWVSISKSGPPGNVETTAQPSPPKEGDLFYNKSTSKLQIYLTVGGWTDIN